MPTQCSAEQLEFAAVEGRRVVAEFDGGRVSSNAGALLLGRADAAIGLIDRLAGCFRDGHDAVFQALLGKLSPKRRTDCAALAGKSTLNRLELHSAQVPDRYHKIRPDAEAIEGLWVELFLESHREAPARIVLDLDATDDPLHGRQEGRFFHGYYGGYCYLPLYIFCGEHLLCAKLRRAKMDGAAGATEEVQRIIAQIRTLCAESHAAAVQSAQLQRPARRFKELLYRTRSSWSRPRRVIGKAEYTATKANPRFLVSSLSAEQFPARELYEDLYCARGGCENRIKEARLHLFADRLSTATFRANQLRL